MDRELSKAYGCLIGVAIGDAMGSPTSFMAPEEIRSRYGYVEDFIEPPPDHPIHAGLKAGQVTDDTELTIVVAESIIKEGKVSTEGYVNALIEWARRRRALETNLIGPSTKAALQKLIKGESVEEAGKLGTTNGGAMRISPIGIVDRRRLDQAILDTYKICLPTHGSNIAISAASAISCAIAKAFEEDSDLSSIVEAAVYGARKGARLGFRIPLAPVEKRIALALDLIKDAKDADEAAKILYEYIGMGVQANEAVPSAIGIVKASGGETMKAITAAVNAGGDADTIASMVGAICGAMNGIESFPRRLIEQVEKVNKIDFKRIARELLRVGR